MKKRFILLTLLTALLAAFSCGKEVSFVEDEAPKTVTVDGREYTLTFEDNFNGNKLNKHKWKCCPESQRQDVGGWWDDSMVEVNDGKLWLWAKLEEDGKPISGGVRSKGLFEQTYGYYECCMKFAPTTGFWGAFWMMCGEVSKVDGSAESGIEIDIIESGECARGGVNHALHWDGYGKEHKSLVKITRDASLYEGFHIYGMAWTKDEYIFYIDGKETWRTNKSGICNRPGYLKLTTEFGSWAAPIVPEELPAACVVDWVRVYQEAE